MAERSPGDTPRVPVACTLDSAGLARRQEELRIGVLSLARRAERLADGFRFEFPAAPDLLSRLGAVLDAERQCCRFLCIAIRAEPDLGTITVELTGPPGTADVLAEWLPASSAP